MFDQTARNRMREKVTASILFKDRKASYVKRWRLPLDLISLYKSHCEGHSDSKLFKLNHTHFHPFVATLASSVSHPFLGDYVRLRQNVQWKKICVENNDQYVVFADIVNKIARSSGKYVPILLVLSTSSMLLLDQRTLQIKYRIPASEIYRMSLSPFVDDIAVFHVKAVSVLKFFNFSPCLPIYRCSSKIFQFSFPPTFRYIFCIQSLSLSISRISR